MDNSNQILKILKELKNDDIAKVDSIMSLFNLQSDLESKKSDLYIRALWAKYMIIYLIIWALAVIGIIIAHGIGNANGQFKISETLIGWLIGYGTLNFLAVPLIIAEYLFPRNKSVFEDLKSLIDRK